MPTKGKSKGLVSFLLAALLIIGFSTAFAPDAGAVTPTYYVSSEYKSSKYYKALTAYTLTGDERFDVVSIAMTQYGYHEGNDESDMGGGNLDGYKNFAEYNRMYGKLDNGEGNGLSYGYSWCAAFVSWCLRQARVDTSVIETFVSCSRAVKNFRSRGMFREASSEYIPRAGDIIFFVKPEDKAQGYVASHVGLVIGTDSGFVYTIEGNTDNYCVCQKSYPFDSEKIVGYAVPNYKTKEGTVYDFTYKTDQKLPGTYTVTKEGLSVYREANVSESIIGELPAGSRLEVKEVNLGWGLIDFGGSEGWIYLLYAERDQFTVTLDSNGGPSSLSYLYKTPGEPFEFSGHAPRHDGYTLLGWSSTKGGMVEYWPDSVYTLDADATFYAVWRVEEYTVEFLDYDGKVLYSNKYPIGSSIVVPPAPVRPADAQFTYEFSSWSPTVSATVTGNEVYRAIYKATPIPETTPAPETTEPMTEPPTPETTPAPAVTEEITTLPEVTKEAPEPEIEVTIQKSPDITTDSSLLINDGYDVLGCGSAVALPAILVIAAIPALFLKKNED